MNFFVIFAAATAPILTTTFQNFIYLLVSLCKNKPQQNKNPEASDTLVRWLGGVGWGWGAELTSEIENVMEFQAVFVVIVVCVAKIFVLMFCFVLFVFVRNLSSTVLPGLLLQLFSRKIQLHTSRRHNHNRAQNWYPWQVFCVYVLDSSIR